MIVSDRLFGCWFLNTIGRFSDCSFIPMKGFLRARVMRTSMTYDIIR